MRFRLLRRRLTISAPRMAVRSALPWPFRWALLAIMAGFCAVIALWAFDFGREIAGLDGGAREEWVRLRTELAKVQIERDKAQSIANTAETLLTAEKAAQSGLLVRIRQMESENRVLRDDLGFFERLIPAATAQGIAIRGLQAEMLDARQIKWQVMVMQAQKNAPEFNGNLALSFTGLLDGKPWSAGLPQGPQSLKLRQYGRMEGVMVLPPNVQVQTVSASVMDGSQVKATQTARL